MKNKIRRGGAALALIVFASIFASTIRATARAGPLIRTQTSTPISSSSSTPSPSPSETPTQTPTKTPKPTETLSPGEYVSAMTIVDRCMYYKGLVEFWITLEPAEYQNITTEHVPLILAIMAQESGCAKRAVSSDGYSSTGLMQVIPRSWTASAECLKKPSCNIYWGIWIYDCAVNNANGDFRLAAMYYNCSEENVHKQISGEDPQACGNGGVHYSERVFKFWLPLIESKLEE